MNIKLFYHSLISDWNHGNAHFLRGICLELIARGHEVTVYEPVMGWSYGNMLKDEGIQAVNNFSQAFPNLSSEFYDPDDFIPEDLLADADLVIMHEWNKHEAVKKAGDYRKNNKDFILLFHDTHHRAVTDSKGIGAYDLSGYDGVLAFGSKIRDIYLQKDWCKAAWTWHEAADTRTFYPREASQKAGDLVWIGNWGDNERTDEIFEFIIEPVKELGLKATFYGVRYPEKALKALQQADIEYGGWLPNYRVPEIFAQYTFTVHIPRKPYVEALPGIPTIRPFEAMACGIPLISAPWHDNEGLFSEGKDYLTAQNGNEMKEQMKMLLEKREVRDRLRSFALQTIENRHTCKHRTEQLLTICQEIKEAKVLTKDKTTTFQVSL